jgi:hypothetical protein
LRRSCSVHRHAPRGERQRDAARADRELERASAPRELFQERDGRGLVAADAVHGVVARRARLVERLTRLVVLHPRTTVGRGAPRQVISPVGVERDGVRTTVDVKDGATEVLID